MVSGCGQSVQGKQLDINYATTTGAGSMTASPITLPRGRYTFFSYADPPGCLKSVALIDRNGKVVAADSNFRGAVASPPPGGPVAAQQMIPTMVQQELSSGPYRLKVTARVPGCAWHVEQILNYVLSNEAPLKPIVPPSAPALDLTLGNSSRDLHFQITAPGIYHVRWSITPCDQYSGDLVRTGSVEHLGDGAAAPVPPGALIGPQTSDMPMFLGAGDWTVRVTTRCFWQLEMSPWRGTMGGGAQGFKA